MEPDLQFNVYNENPPNVYKREHIYATQSFGSPNDLLPLSATLVWDICAVSRNTNDSLSALSLSAFGKLDDHYLQTIDWNLPWVSSVSSVSGFLPYFPVYSVTALGTFGLPVFNFKSGATTILSLSDSPSRTGILTSTTPYTSGWLNFNTGYYNISSGGMGPWIDNATLEVDYTPYLGAYTVGTVVNANSGAGLTLEQSDDTYMFRVSSIISTTDVNNTTAIEYFPLYPENINFKLIKFNNLPEGREVNFALVNQYGPLYTAIAPWITGYWDYDIPVGGGVTVTSPYKDDYKTNSLIYTGLFDATTRQAVLSTFGFRVSAFVDTVDPAGLIFSGISSVIVDEYPDLNSLNFQPLIANNNPLQVRRKIWRTTQQNLISAEILAEIPGWDGIGGNLGVDWGDGTIENITSFVGISSISGIKSHTYAVPPVSTFSLVAYINTISATNWLSAHSASLDMEIQFVDRFLSGIFIAYPEYYFDGSGGYHLLNPTNYTNSSGVCAYGEGSNFAINLSAWEPELGKNTKYQWGIGWALSSTVEPTYVDIISSSEGTREDSYNFGDMYTYTPAGTALSLTVFNDDFPPTMYPYYTNDNGDVVKYPNFDVWPYAHTTVDNSNRLFQNARLIRYENITPVLSALTASTTVDGITVTASLGLYLPSYSPVEVIEQSLKWTLSAAGWSSVLIIDSTSTEFSYTLTEGNGVIPGTLKKDTQVTITLSVSGAAYKDISVRDFDTRIESFTAGPVSASILAEFTPTLKIFANDLHSLTGETIFFQNITTTATSATQASAYIWDVGDGSGTIVVPGSSTDLIPATYNTVGTYSVNLTSITNLGQIIESNFANIIRVDDRYLPFNTKVQRIYGSQNIEYPNQFNDIQIKPNEWVTDTNINSAFDKIHENIEYLQSAAKKYLEPPSKYYGWLGQSKYNETDLSWHVTIPKINSEYNSLENVTTNTRGFNNIRGISVNNDKMYVATDTKLYILSSDYHATEIDSRDYKTIGDQFFDIKGISVNSTGRIYVLDSAVQQVVVFDNYETNGWKLLFSWGKYGGSSAFEGFSNPVDLHIDSQDNVWITDRGNNVVKKYTKAGGWLMTLSSSKFSSLVSTAIDINKNIHVLTDDKIIMFNSKGTYIKSYSVKRAGQVAKKIINGRDGFLYVAYDLSVAKITPDGEFAGRFADTFSNISYGSLYHDINRNLYVTNGSSILKFYEKITIDSVITDIDIDFWSMDDIYIDKDEYVQDWVYNRSISRLWDNIDIIRRSIIGSIYETTDRQKKVKNIVVGLTPKVYEELFNTKSKEEIFIGINEIVTADSVNRVLFELYTLLSICLSVITRASTISDDSGLSEVDIDDADGGTDDQGIGWRWTDVASWGINPRTWKQVSSSGFYATTWENAISN